MKTLRLYQEDGFLDVALSSLKKYPYLKYLPFNTIEFWDADGERCSCGFKGYLFGRPSCGNPAPAQCEAPGNHLANRFTLDDATNDPEELKRIFKKLPGAQLGVLTGRKGGIVAFIVRKRKKPSKRFLRIKALIERHPTFAVDYGSYVAHVYSVSNTGSPIVSKKKFIAAGVLLAADDAVTAFPPSVTELSDRGPCRVVSDSTAIWEGTPPVEQALFDIAPLPKELSSMRMVARLTEVKNGK